MSRRGSLLALLVVVGLCLPVGCSSSTGRSPSSGAGGADNQAMPRFTGPYADDLRSAWIESRSTFVRGVISDGVITDQEWAEVAHRLAQCLAAKGLKFTGFRPDGSYSVDTGSVPGDQANAELPSCERESGEQWIGYLRTAMATNPHNTPIAEIMAACLIRLGVVGPGYTKEQYLRDAPNMSFPYLALRS